MSCISSAEPPSRNRRQKPTFLPGKGLNRKGLAEGGKNQPNSIGLIQTMPNQKIAVG